MKGMFLPLNIIQGDQLKFSFDVLEDGVLLDPSTLNIEGSFSSQEDGSFPVDFEFSIDSEINSRVNVLISRDVSEGLESGPYSYQIRYNPLSNESEVKTILFGSLDVYVSPMM